MKTRTASRPFEFIGGLPVAALACLGATLGLVVVPVHADPLAAGTLSTPELPRSLALDPTSAGKTLPLMSLTVVSGSEAGLTSADSDQSSYIPRGNEMSGIASVELERNDRRFRSRVVNWARNQSLAAGLATDFLLHGSDTGVHLDLQSGSAYVVRWRTRF